MRQIRRHANLAERFARACQKLFRRNPRKQNLARLETIAEARRIYKETGSVKKTSELLNLDRKIITKWVKDLVDEREQHKQALMAEAIAMRKQGYSSEDISKKISEKYSFLPWSLKSETALNYAIREQLKEAGESTQIGPPIKIDKYGLGPQIIALRNQNLNTAQIHQRISQEIKTRIEQGTLPGDAKIDYHTLKRWLKRRQIPKKISAAKHHHNQIQTLYQRGLSDKEICEVLNLRRDIVEDWRRDHQLPSNKKVRLNLLKQEALKLKNSMSVLAISKKLKVDRGTINKWFAEGKQ